MRIKYTSEYPTRYVAFDNPGVLVLAKDPQYRGGFEAMVYDAPTVNRSKPGLHAGVYGEVYNHQGAHWFVHVHATRPIKARTQKSWTKMCNTLAKAQTALKHRIKKAHRWITR